MTTEYTFASALPLLIATTFYEPFSNHYPLPGEHFLMLAVGSVMSMVIALTVVKTFLRFVTRHNFTPFPSFRIGLRLPVPA